MRYVISATVETTTHSDSGEWHGAYQVPTFILSDWLQGIRNEDDARRIAEQIINPAGNLKVHIGVAALADG